jgi:hypothetical protein
MNVSLGTANKITVGIYSRTIVKIGTGILINKPKRFGLEGEHKTYFLYHTRF